MQGISIIQPQPSIGLEHQLSEVEALNKIQQALRESPAGRHEGSSKSENRSNRSESKEKEATKSPRAERQHPGKTETALVPVKAPAQGGPTASKRTRSLWRAKEQIEQIKLKKEGEAKRKLEEEERLKNKELRQKRVLQKYRGKRQATGYQSHDGRPTAKIVPHVTIDAGEEPENAIVLANHRFTPKSSTRST